MPSSKPEEDLVSILPAIGGTLKKLQLYSYVTSERLMRCLGEELGKGIAQRMISVSPEQTVTEMADIFESLGLGNLTIHRHIHGELESITVGVADSSKLPPNVAKPWCELRGGVMKGIVEMRLKSPVTLRHADVEDAKSRSCQFRIQVSGQAGQ